MRKTPSPTSLRITASVAALIAALLLSGCMPSRNIDIKRASELSGIMQITTEAEPWLMALTIYSQGKSVTVVDPMSETPPNAFQWLCCGADHPNLLAAPANPDKPNVVSFPRFVEKTEFGVVNPHRNYFIGMLAAGGVPDNKIFVSPDGEAWTMKKLAFVALTDLSPSGLTSSGELKTGAGGNELAWTFLAAANYYDLELTWTDQTGKQQAKPFSDRRLANAGGEVFSMDDIVGVALSRPIGWGAAAGTWELLGLSAILRESENVYPKHRGVWKDARKRMDAAIAAARANQTDAGAFGPEWFKSRKEPENPLDAIFYTGHVLDWLVFALPPDELRKPWIRKSVFYLAGEMNLYMDQLIDYPENTMIAQHALRMWLEKTGAVDKRQ